MSDERVKLFKASNPDYLARQIEENKRAHETISSISYSSHYGPYDDKTFPINQTVYSAIVVYKSKL